MPLIESLKIEFYMNRQLRLRLVHLCEFHSCSLLYSAENLKLIVRTRETFTLHDVDLRLSHSHEGQRKRRFTSNALSVMKTEDVDLRLSHTRINESALFSVSNWRWSTSAAAKRLTTMNINKFDTKSFNQKVSHSILAYVFLKHQRKSSITSDVVRNN